MCVRLIFLILALLPKIALACQPPQWGYDHNYKPLPANEVLASFARSPWVLRGPVVPTGKVEIKKTDLGIYVIWQAEFRAELLDHSPGYLSLPAFVQYKCNWRNCARIQPFVLNNRGHIGIWDQEPIRFTFGGNGMCTGQYQYENDLAFSDAAWAFMTACKRGACPAHFEGSYFDYKQEEPYPYGLTE